MNRCVYQAGLLALLPLLAPAAWADRECHFDAGSVTVAGGNYVKLTPRGPVSSATSLSTDRLANYSGTFKSHCDTGPDGQNLWGDTNIDNSGYKWHEPGALFPTNIPGIRYSVHIKPNRNADIADGYLPSSNQFTQVAEISDAVDSEGGPLDGKPWDIYLDFYQTEEYTGNQGQSLVHPRDDVMLGRYRLGGSGQNSNVVSIYVNKNSFGVDIITPTCTSAVADVSNSTVDFGDVNINDLGGGRVPAKPFSITLSGCSLVNSVTAKLTTLFASEDGNMMANAWMGQPGYAEGLGVQIRDTYSNTLRPNDLNSSSVINGLKMAGTVKLNYTAELRADGKARKAGPFQATGIFTLSYQ
ncbi:fimbrial protein [Chimaeribacter arupi]|uniref:fimbrial protein n=1 Tax=Chimaeribacter arupi TaxID=2060066 RepID=UPI0027120DF4|nr:fimbrial protein [Chimaeribacter arupi]WKZ91376.1 fimbrial protein [Chimaeribacter arupi]